MLSAGAVIAAVQLPLAVVTPVIGTVESAFPARSVTVMRRSQVPSQRALVDQLTEYGADVSADLDRVPESRGLKAIAEGFGLVYADDHAILAAELPLYDALHAWCARQVSD